MYIGVRLDRQVLLHSNAHPYSVSQTFLKAMFNYRLLVSTLKLLKTMANEAKIVRC